MFAKNGCKMARRENIEVAIGHILESYSADVKETTYRCAKEAANETRDRLRNGSETPRKSGEYARSWRVKKGKDSYTVHSSKPGLTHLLEFGHVTRNGTGRTYGNTPAHPHIKDAEKFGTERFTELVMEEVGSL